MILTSTDGFSLFFLIFLCLFSKPFCCKKNKVILISFDGFRHDYLDMAKSKGLDISAFETLYQQGFRGRVVPIMPTITFPTHFATATGRYAENHGIMANIFYSPEYNVSFSYRNALDALEPRWWNYNDNEPIWMTNERHGDRKSCVYFWPGSASSYANKLPTRRRIVYNASIDFTTRIDQMLEWMQEDDKITLCMVYVEEPDVSGHRFGPNSKEVMNKVEELNHLVENLIKKIKVTPGMSDSVNVILTSDHGMAEVQDQNIVPLYDILDPEEYIANPSRVFFGIWPKHGGPTVMQMYNKLVKANVSGLSIYLKEDLPKRYFYAGTPRCPPLVLIADPKYAIRYLPSQRCGRGEHGYDNQDTQMHALMIAAGPNVRQLDGVQRIQQVDIYALICGILELQMPNKIDGDLQRVARLMKPPPTQEFVKQFMFYSHNLLATDTSCLSVVVRRTLLAVGTLFLTGYM
ncbi:Bis 5'-adenosyl triphosphatase enpp4 [Taenia solium]|eukprot:TsM_000120100 transcript=TsM_000120100 gene=TsM_000120100